MPSVRALADTISLRGYMGVVQVLFAIVAGGRSGSQGKPVSGRKAPHALLPGIRCTDRAEAVWRAHRQFNRSSARFASLIWVPKYDEPLLAFALAVLLRLRHASGLEQYGKPPPSGHIGFDCLCGINLGPGVFAVSGPGGKGGAA